jgi:hypothetical protein
LAREYVDKYWLTAWRWKPVNGAGDKSAEPIPKDWTVTALSVNAHDGHILVHLYVSNTPNNTWSVLPKNFQKAWRFASRCKNHDKRKAKLEGIAIQLADAYNWPLTKWLLPKCCVDKPSFFVDVRMDLKVEYPPELAKVADQYKAAQAAITKAEQAREEFRKILPAPVRDMMSILLHNNPRLMSFGGFPPWMFLGR